MSYTLYLDDIRFPKDPEHWDHIARSYEEFFWLVKKYGPPDEISFDHDLGDNVPTGFDIVKEFVRMDMDGEIDISNWFVFLVHSANPVGAKNIQEYLKQYLWFKRNG